KRFMRHCWGIGTGHSCSFLSVYPTGEPVMTLHEPIVNIIYMIRSFARALHVKPEDGSHCGNQETGCNPCLGPVLPDRHRSDRKWASPIGKTHPVLADGGGD